jgi:hypothetical protein
MALWAPNGNAADGMRLLTLCGHFGLLAQAVVLEGRSHRLTRMADFVSPQARSSYL